jgi:L-iditol 2-dehydrogenase
MWPFLRKNLTLKSGGTRSRRHYLAKAGQYFQKYPELAASYVTHVYDIEDLTAAFERASVPAPARAKVAVRFRRIESAPSPVPASDGLPA